MVTIVDKYNTVEYRGLSTDTKPTDATNGSSFLEINTGKLFIYNASGAQWVEQPFNGGGGGSSDNEWITLTLKPVYDSGNDLWNFESDDDIAAGLAAVEAGKPVKCVIDCTEAGPEAIDGAELTQWSAVSIYGMTFPVALGMVGSFTPTAGGASAHSIGAYFQDIEGGYRLQYFSVTFTGNDMPTE